MAKKNFQSGIVYSTNKDFKFVEEDESLTTPPSGDPTLKVSLDTKQRRGKAVTIVDGYFAKDIEEFGKKLKVYCGTGGAVKDGRIIIQGDNREKVVGWLVKNGFKNVKKL